MTFCWSWDKVEDPPLSLPMRMTNCSDELDLKILTDKLMPMPKTRLHRRRD